MLPILILGQPNTATGEAGYHTRIIAMRGPLTYGGSHTRFISLRSGYGLGGQHTRFMALRSAPGSGSHTRNIILRDAGDIALLRGWPAPEVMRGLELSPLRISCELEQAISMSYEDSVTTQTGTLTYYDTPGFTLPPTVTLTISGGGSSFNVILSVDNSTSERSMDALGQWTRTVRLHNPYGTALASKPVSELVSWHLTPTRPAGLPPREEKVSDVVRRAFLEAGCVLEGADPLVGMTWREGTRDYSTEGKTALTIWQNAYGQLGRLFLRGNVGYFVPNGAAGFGDEALISPCALNGLKETNTWAHVPSRIQFSGPDVDAEIPLIPDIQRTPDQRQDKASDYDEATRTRTITVTTWTRDNSGIEERVSIVVGDVVAKWTDDDGEPRLHVFEHVLLSAEVDKYTYHPSNPKMLIKEETRKSRFAYEAGTALENFTVGGHYFGGIFLAGTLVGDELGTTIQQWYGPDRGALSGYLDKKTTTEKKLADLQQPDADMPIGKRGPLAGRNYATSIKQENYVTSDGGVTWFRLYQDTGPKSLAVYDADTGEGTRVLISYGIHKSGTEPGVTPPHVDWPREGENACDTKVALVKQPLRRLFIVPTGRVAALQTVSFAYAATLQELERLGDLYAAGQGIRTEYSYELAVATGIKTGQGYKGQLITSVSVSQSADGSVSSSVSAVLQQPAPGYWTTVPLGKTVTGVVTQHLGSNLVQAELLLDVGMDEQQVNVWTPAGESLPALGGNLMLELDVTGHWVIQGGANVRCR